MDISRNVNSVHLCIYLSVIFAGVKVNGVVNAGTTSDTEQTPALKPEERYQDMFPLTADNFTTTVMRNRDPWIVIFHDGSVDRQWKTMATQSRGTVWVGIVDVTRETELVKSLDHDASSGTVRVYPHGYRLHKERGWKYVRTEHEARSAALSSLPDVIQEIDGDDVKDVLTDSFMSRPSRFPVFVILDEDETPSLFKALAIRFEKYFLFCKLVRPTTDDLSKIGLVDINLSPPELFILVTTARQIHSAKAVRYSTERFGAMNYTSVMEFLFSVNGQFRHDLPGENLAHLQREAEMSDIITIEEKRFQILHGASRARGVQSEPKTDGRHSNENIGFKVTKETRLRDEL